MSRGRAALGIASRRCSPRVSASAPGWAAAGLRDAGADDCDRDRLRSNGCASSSRRDSPSARWATGSRPSARSQSQRRGVTPRLTRSSYLAAAGRAKPPPPVPQGLGGTPARGLSLPGAVRVLAAHDRPQARRRPAGRLPQGVGESRPALRALEEPDAVRRARDRVDDRGGDSRAGGTQARRGRDLQPAAATDAAGDRRDDSLRPRAARHRVAAQIGSGVEQPLQHPHAGAGCRRRRSPTPGWRRCGRPRTRPGWTISTSSASPTRCTISSPRTRTSSCARRASTASAASDDRGRSSSGSCGYRVTAPSGFAERYEAAGRAR